MAERVKVEHGFGPLYHSDSRILIRGSFPSVRSRAQSFYYGHPQNRFWKILAKMAGEEAPEAIADKTAFLKRNRIALYDVIESCTIIGSSDSSIDDVVVTDLAPILRGSAIGNRIYTNGGKASELYKRYIYPEIGIAATQLPSSSPANARMSLDDLVEAWSELIGSL